MSNPTFWEYSDKPISKVPEGTRFQDMRKSVVKKSWMDEGPAKHREIATVQRLSPYNPDQSPRIAKGDIYKPTYNRASRRAAGNINKRKRIRGTIPPHPVQVLHVAHRIEREGIRMRAKKARADHKANAK